MTKPLTVRQFQNRMQKLIDEGHGGAPVMVPGEREGFRAAGVRYREEGIQWIGPSEWDRNTHALADPDGKGFVSV